MRVCLKKNAVTSWSCHLKQQPLGIYDDMELTAKDLFVAIIP